jgi:hypothetical protein
VSVGAARSGYSKPDSAFLSNLDATSLPMGKDFKPMNSVPEANAACDRQ